MKDIPYFSNQVKIALKNCGSIDHSCLEEYISVDGYIGLAKVLENNSELKVIEEMKKSQSGLLYF